MTCSFLIPGGIVAFTNSDHGLQIGIAGLVPGISLLLGDKGGNSFDGHMELK